MIREFPITIQLVAEKEVFRSIVKDEWKMYKHVVHQLVSPSQRSFVEAHSFRIMKNAYIMLYDMVVYAELSLQLLQYHRFMFAFIGV